MTKWYKKKDAAKALNMPVALFYVWLAKKIIPQPTMMIGQRGVYSQQEIDAIKPVAAVYRPYRPRHKKANKARATKTKP